MHDLSIALGILIDKLQLTQGEATSITITRNEQVMTHDEYNRLLANLPSAQVIEISNSQEADEAPKKFASERRTKDQDFADRIRKQKGDYNSAKKATIIAKRRKSTNRTRRKGDVRATEGRRKGDGRAT